MTNKTFIVISTIVIVLLIGALIYQAATRGDTLFIAIIMGLYGIFMGIWAQVEERKHKKTKTKHQ